MQMKTAIHTPAIKFPLEEITERVGVGLACNCDGQLIC